MCASWIKKYDPQLIAEGLEAIRMKFGEGITVGPLEGPHFDGTRLFEYKILLNSAVKLESEINEIDKDTLLHEAIYDAARRGRISSRSLLAAISRAEAEYLARESEKYMLLTSLSVQPTGNLTRRRISGATITFSDSEPRGIDLGEIAADAKRLLGITSSHYPTFVKIHVGARSHHEAVSSAAKALEYLTALWNLFYNLRTPFRIQLAGRRDNAVNSIRIGPVQSLHDPDGKRISPLLWFRSAEEARPATKFKDLRQDWASLKTFERNIRDEAKAIRSHIEIEEVITAYGLALSESDPGNAFLKLWSLLEDLTGTREKRYDTTLQRVLFSVADRDYHRQVLEHLRDRRNDMVHSAMVSQNAYLHVYQLKRYVEHLIFLFLNVLGRFESIEDLFTVMDLPYKIKDLRSRQRLVDEGISLRESLQQSAV